MEKIEFDSTLEKFTLLKYHLTAFRFEFYKLKDDDYLVGVTSQKYRSKNGEAVEIIIDNELAKRSFEQITVEIIDKICEPFQLSKMQEYNLKSMFDKTLQKPIETIEDVHFDIEEFNELLNEYADFKDEKSVEKFKYFVEDTLKDLSKGVTTNKNLMVYNLQKTGDYFKFQEYFYDAAIQTIRKYNSVQDNSSEKINFILVKSPSTAVEKWKELKNKLMRKDLCILHLDSEHLAESARMLTWIHEVTEKSSLKLLVFSNIKDKDLIKIYPQVSEAYENIETIGMKYKR